jgi:hypothetical protein
MPCGPLRVCLRVELLEVSHHARADGLTPGERAAFWLCTVLVVALNAVSVSQAVGGYQSARANPASRTSGYLTDEFPPLGLLLCPDVQSDTVFDDKGVSSTVRADGTPSAPPLRPCAVSPHMGTIVNVSCCYGERFAFPPGYVTLPLCQPCGAAYTVRPREWPARAHARNTAARRRPCAGCRAAVERLFRSCGEHHVPVTPGACAGEHSELNGRCRAACLRFARCSCIAHVTPAFKRGDLRAWTVQVREMLARNAHKTRAIDRRASPPQCPWCSTT